MKKVVSFAAIGLGAYAYASSMDKKTKKQWKKKMDQFTFTNISNYLPNQHSMKQMGKRFSKAIS
ncbi:hypothetical protein QA612_03145 [Evansella sp. AB-P1]|uniref:hypothetical protein n=1 Tax=Evansella sp. AB-P1 TaxID=3037653 RepID=UPI00241C3ACE|nr:hypothetical protein [Evansella sp. AB-P1]MDG5786472.1 hypothetical protein [Evansella sp. AB-P1]